MTAEFNSDILIRPMCYDDIEKVAQGRCPPWTTSGELRTTWENYYQEQQANMRTVAILEHSSLILGWGSLLRSSQNPRFKGFPEISSLWIDEAHQGCGLGKKIILWLEDLARSEGYHQIGIGTGLNHYYGPAQKLYIRLGYVPDGHGITYKSVRVIPGEKYPVDDDLILWLTKPL
jgi:GNAT superfamily N-acetyltransferase